MKNTARITLNGLTLSVHLGWPHNERKKEQLIVLDVFIDFTKPPLGCVTDQLTDTYCYAALISAIEKEIKERDFRLIEHLGYEIHRIITDYLPSDCNVWINLTKKPAIGNLTGGVTFSYGYSG